MCYYCPADVLLSNLSLMTRRIYSIQQSENLLVIKQRSTVSRVNCKCNFIKKTVQAQSQFQSESILFVMNLYILKE